MKYAVLITDRSPLTWLKSLKIIEKVAYVVWTEEKSKRLVFNKWDEQEMDRLLDCCKFDVVFL